MPVAVTDLSVYEKLGAELGISQAVDDFYDRVLGDPLLAPFFADADLVALRHHQVLMLSAATGGPVTYTGLDMAAAHAGRGIMEQHFDRVVEHLVATLSALGVDEETIGQVGAALTPLRPAIVTA
jgi:hemoglobin